MPQLEPISQGRFSEIYHEFLAHFDNELTRADWSTLFRIKSDNIHQHAGFILTDRGKLAGMLGMIFSQRHFNGKSRNICNLHSWMVKPEYRGHSLLLMRTPLKLKDHLVTDLSPTQGVQKISAKLGFKSLDSALRILLPTVLPIHHNNSQYCRLLDPSIAHRLSPHDQQIFLDHDQPHLKHLCIDTPQGSCYVVYSLVTRWRLNYCQIHYHNSDELFETHSDTIRHAIMQQTGCAFIAMHDRLTRNMRLPRTLRLPIANKQIYLGSPDDVPFIDTLYTDVSLLNLSSLGLKEILRSLRIPGASSLNRSPAAVM